MAESKSTTLFGVRLSQSERSLWERYCALHFEGIEPSSVARSMLMQIASDALEEPYPERENPRKNLVGKVENLSTFQRYRAVKRVEKTEKKGALPKRKKTSVYLVESELNALKDISTAQEITQSNLIGIAVRSMLRIESEPMPDELENLRESNKEMKAIGRNLNQITRRLNQNISDFSEEELAIDRVEKSINRHVLRMSEYLTSVRSRWDLERLL